MRMTVGELRQVIKEEVMRDMYYEHARRTGGRLDEAGFKDWMKGVGKKVSDVAGKGLDAAGRGVNKMTDKLERGVDAAMDAGRKAVGRATDKQQRVIKIAKKLNSELHDDVLDAVSKEFPEATPTSKLNVGNILHRPLYSTLKLLKRAKIAEGNCESMAAVDNADRYWADISDVKHELRSYIGARLEADQMWYENQQVWDMPKELGIEKSEKGIFTLMAKNERLIQSIMNVLSTYESSMKHTKPGLENTKNK